MDHKRTEATFVKIGYTWNRIGRILQFLSWLYLVAGSFFDIILLQVLQLIGVSLVCWQIAANMESDGLESAGPVTATVVCK